jgi:hypothetical protein
MWSGREHVLVVFCSSAPSPKPTCTRRFLHREHHRHGFFAALNLERRGNQRAAICVGASAHGLCETRSRSGKNAGRKNKKKGEEKKRVSCFWSRSTVPSTLSGPCLKRHPHRSLRLFHVNDAARHADLPECDHPAELRERQPVVPGLDHQERDARRGRR